MRRLMVCALAVVACAFAPGTALQQPAAPQRIDLAERLSSGKLILVNRSATALQGSKPGVHLDDKAGNGVAWIDGVDFSQGTIEVDIRGRDMLQRSFVGLAFHRKDDSTYEAIYLRPFNFRAADAERRAHSVQYISLPDYDWSRLRQERAGEFEHAVDPSLVPTEWIPVRVVVTDKAVQVFAGPTKSPALDVRRLTSHGAGMVGLWVGNNSDGDFANLRIAPAK